MDIARAFESLDHRPSSLLRGPGLSMVILARKEAEDIMAVGTYAQGFVLTYMDGNPEYNQTSDMNKPIQVGEVIKIFQAYARNEDWGQSNFKWERFDLKPKVSKVVIGWLIILLIGIAVMALLSKFI